jgi:hypothetical protein
MLPAPQSYNLWFKTVIENLDNTYMDWDLKASQVLPLTNALYGPHNLSFENLRDALSSGQLCSKLWLLRALKTLNLEASNVYHLGCWHGLLGLWVSQSMNADLHLVDIDKDSVDLASAVCCGNTIYPYVCDSEEFTRLYRPLTDELFLNTSCEHMSNQWVANLLPGTQVVAQSTNYLLGDGHVNTVDSAESFEKSLGLSKVLYQGTLKFPMYERYMIIGKK